MQGSSYALLLSLLVSTSVIGTTLPSSASAETPQKLPAGVFRVDSVDGLPFGHPCHDATRIAVNGVDDKDHPVTEVRSLAELGGRGPSYNDSGSRTFEAFQWSTDGVDDTVDEAVVACNLTGTSFAPIRVIGAADPLWAPGGVAFEYDRDVEPNATEYASLMWLRRPASSAGLPGSLSHLELWSVWTTARSEAATSNDDESNSLGYVARAGIVAVEDSDGDSVVEVTAFVLEDCRTFNRLRCKAAPETTEVQFAVMILTREGEHEVGESVILDDQLREVASEQVVRTDASQTRGLPGDDAAAGRPNEPQQERGHLEARALEHRAKALDAARAILAAERAHALKQP